MCLWNRGGANRSNVSRITVSYMIHVLPINDEREHIEDGTTCWCDPQLITDEPELIIVHNSADGRELIEQAEAINNGATDERELSC